MVRSPFGQRVIGGLARGFIALAKALGRRRATAVAIGVMRAVAPLLPENRLAAANIAKAFPERGEAERAAILAGAWDNLARTGVEFSFLDEILDGFDLEHPERSTITVSGAEHLAALRDDGKPAIVFSAHLANWELTAAIAGRYGLPLSILFRAPTNIIFAQDILKTRDRLMGKFITSQKGAALEIAAAMSRGDHFGILIDQRVKRAPVIPFFGRPAHSNDVAVRLARGYDCPVHGARAIRLPGGRFHLELTPPIALPRDADGDIDIKAANVILHGIVEGWIREHPEQWLWQHNRWRL
jgi:KDO2-lipid IV(A) lauroyltransferase